MLEILYTNISFPIIKVIFLEGENVNKKILLLLIPAIVALLIIVGMNVIANNPSISSDEAKSIAEEHLGGKAVSVDLEKEGGRLIYEVHVTTDSGDYEVEVDAHDGSVIEVELEDGSEDEDDDDTDNDDE